jgi:hypothetical protein
MDSPTNSAHCSNIHVAIVGAAIVVAYQQYQKERIQKLRKNDLDFAFLNEDEFEIVVKQAYTTLFLHHSVVAVAGVTVMSARSVAANVVLVEKEVGIVVDYVAGENRNKTRKVVSSNHLSHLIFSSSFQKLKYRFRISAS